MGAWSSTGIAGWRRASRARSTRPASGRVSPPATPICAAPTSSTANTHPQIGFRGSFTERTADTAFKGEVELTIRGVTRTVPLDIGYIGEWKTPWWEGDENKGEMRRIGFEATARIDRHDFGVSWQDEIPRGGVVVGNEIELILDVEAILLEDL